MGYFIRELTNEQCQTLIHENTVVVLPIGGGAKEHGRQLPMGTDYYICDWLAAEITRRTDVLTLPTLPYAYFPGFIKWKGSVSIDYQHFIDYTRDILMSYVQAGVKKFLILDFGVSTHVPLKLLALTMNNDYDVKVAVSNYTGCGFAKSREVCEQARGGHADEAETSAMLYIRPELVHMEKAAEEYEPAFPHTGGDGVEKIFFPMRLCTPHGSNGNSTLATKEKGETILSATIDDLVDFLEEFIRWKPKADED